MKHLTSLLASALHRSFILFSYFFLYLPILILVIFSFNSERFPSSWNHFTLHWYRELFQASDLWRSFFYSFFVATSATLLSLGMGIFLIFFRSQGGKVRRMVSLFYGNLLIPETMLAISLLTYFTLLQIPLGLITLIIAHTIFSLGFIIPIFYTRYLHIDDKLSEASLTLGATPIQTFFKITLPLLKPTILSVGLLIFILSFDDFVLSYFCAGTKVETLSLHLLSMLRLGISPIINALSTLIFFVSGVCILILLLPSIRKRLFPHESV